MQQNEWSIGVGWVHSRNTNFWHSAHERNLREIIDNLASGNTESIADILRMLEEIAADVVRKDQEEIEGGEPHTMTKGHMEHWENVRTTLEKAAEDIDPE